MPVYAGGRLPLTTQLADRVRAMLAEPGRWRLCPTRCANGWGCSAAARCCRNMTACWSRPSRAATRNSSVAYCFEGRNAHQTLGMLLTRRMERAGLRPLGFVATDYVIAVWSLKPVRDMAALFDQDMLGDDLEEWMAESSLLNRTFRNVAVIAGLIERRHPGEEKSGRQVTFNSDLIYDVLRKHEPRPRAAARDPGRCRRRADRCAPPRRHAGPGEGQDHASAADPGVAAGRSGNAGDRARSRYMARRWTICCRKRPRN